ncbi:carboxylesterase family protein [Pedobacter agri]|uniref:carboxylesterase family protein n=1 Tax=Pedobacter agri TaxID=454586 RepID=UPI0029314F7D|nr:dienelactone hydrolase family protein [Pedobacter agri]
MIQDKPMYKFFIVIGFMLLINPAFSQRRHRLPENSSIKFDSIAFATQKHYLNGLSADEYQKKTFKFKDIHIPYRLLEPSNFKSTKKYPLVVSLHNSIRVGNDNEKQLEPLSRIWLKPQIRKNFQAFVLAPQFETRSTNYAFDEVRNVLVAKPNSNLIALIDLIEQLEKELNIDENRIYLIGYSMGGSSVQNLLSLSPGTFAAMISIAGVPDFSSTNALQSKPIWLIHGEKDNENPFNGSEVLFNELKQNKKVRFSIYSNLDHNTINYPLLNTDELPKWLFQWKK